MSSSTFSQIFTSYLSNLPTLIAYLVACVIVIIKWRQAGGTVSLWALLAFGLSLAMAVIMPLVYASIQSGRGGATDMTSIATIYRLLGWAQSFLRTLIVVFFLLAIYSGRAPRAAQTAWPA